MAMTATFVVVLVVSTLCWCLRHLCWRNSVIAFMKEERRTLVALERARRNR